MYVKYMNGFIWYKVYTLIRHAFVFKNTLKT